MPNPAMLTKIEHLENMTFSEKLRHFQGKTPWAGLTLPNLTAVPRRSVNLIDGNVTRMPKLGGKPCFGNPIAWVAHGIIETAQFKWGIGKTRCGKCRAREGCDLVAETRLNITPEVASATQAFRAAGGARAFHQDTQRTNAAQALGRLEKALVAAGPFTSINDEYAASWARNEKQRDLDNDARRQREKRARDARSELKAHQVPEELVSQLEHERIFRIVRFRMFAKSVGAPMTVRIDPDGTNATFTADVWRAKTILSIRAIQTKPITAYAIAGLMTEEGRTYGLKREVLRDRVGRALKRIDVLEASPLPEGIGSVWPPFSPKEALDWLANNPLRELA
jgi:hypothetical protein